MGNADIIKELKRAGLTAACPHCSCDFPLSKGIIFDGLGEFPDVAIHKKTQLLEELGVRMAELKKKKLSAEGAEEKAIKVGVGKTLEKIVPAHRDFNLPLPDCRPLFEPGLYYQLQMPQKVHRENAANRLSTVSSREYYK